MLLTAKVGMTIVIIYNWFIKCYFKMLVKIFTLPKLNHINKEMNLKLALEQLYRG